MVAMARGDEPASGSGAAESVRLSEAHVAAVNRRRRIYVNNDVGYDAVAIATKLTAIKPDEWIAARFSVFDQPGSQVDCVGWCLDEGNIAAYPSKIIPELQYPTLLRSRKEGVDIAQRIVEESQSVHVSPTQNSAIPNNLHPSISGSWSRGAMEAASTTAWETAGTTTQT